MSLVFAVSAARPYGGCANGEDRHSQNVTIPTYNNYKKISPFDIEFILNLSG